MKKLVSMEKMLSDAEKLGYAVGAFNVSDLAGVEAVALGAEEEHSPVIIQIYTTMIDLLGPKYIYAMSEVAAQSVNVPVALHLDHGSDLDTVKKCIDAGFTSVMIDGSKLPLDENIQVTKMATELAHAAGITSEGELGRIGSGAEDISEAERAKFLTTPEEAQRFVQETGVDALAVAIGSAHGLYKFKPKLDFARLKEIRKAVDVRSVLHGGSDLPEDQIQKAIQLGITKVNVATDLAGAYSDALRTVVDNTAGIIWPGKVFGAVREGMKELVRNRIRLFGSSGGARNTKT